MGHGEDLFIADIAPVLQDAVDAVQLSGPVQHIVAEVPLPAADVRELLRGGELFEASLQYLFHLLLCGNIAYNGKHLLALSLVEHLQRISNAHDAVILVPHRYFTGIGEVRFAGETLLQTTCEWAAVLRHHNVEEG